MSETIPAPVTAASTIKSDSLLTRLTKVFDHNRYGIIAMAAASILIVSACVESQTASPTTGQPVTRNALNEQALDFNVEHERKVGALKSEMEKLTQDMRILEIEDQNTYDSFISAYEDLDEQDARKAKPLIVKALMDIKGEILNKPEVGWNESDVVAGFKWLQKIDITEIGNQIKAITQYHYGSYATYTDIDRYSGVYINDNNGNKPGNYYIAVVCYSEDVTENEAKVSSVVYSEKVMDSMKDDNLWKPANKPIKSITKQLDLGESYLKSNKEDQFEVLSEFITNNFDIVDDIDPKGLNAEEPT